ncbi:hypothetical protein RM555_10015 [Micromonospora sp. DSM 115977]|uniref:Uncharacterized protein n=1 Tax=Micromonospora reichwaldensis TaxID=3075516 RepID=A0ABU2WTR9_9ACTN|nr:hypothetical protein [Micromonospora sp. DSM 115977]MDT0529319.1 hypothetical protein [Micromonospora sp. DSM 115977]
MATVWRYALRAGVVLGCLTGAGLPAPAQAAFATELSGLPDEFTAGGRVETVSAVVSRDDGGCVKVRWSMVLRVRGMRLDQVRVDRVEETGSFPLDIRAGGDVARLTDRRLDPGTLCPGRTVTARYRLAFAGDVTRGRITLAAEAYDANLRLLSRQTATRSVVGSAARTAAPEEPESRPVPADTTGPAGETGGAAEPGAAPTTDKPATDDLATEGALPAAGAGRPVAGAGGFGAVQAAFLLGGLLLSLGLGLLLRLRHLTRAAGADDDVGPDRRRERAAVSGRWRAARR